jgi:hypothetical protein
MEILLRFTDYEKAYNRIDRIKLRQILENNVYPNNTETLSKYKNLYRIQI